MKIQLNLFAALLLASAGSALATVRYVDVNSTNSVWPYTSWATAASGIQEAIEVAAAGDEIVVTNGTYSVGGRSTVDQPTTTNRVVVDKPLALRSVNGPQFTIIDGRGVFRCVYLTNDASLFGFTLTNGFARSGDFGSGGGAYGGTLNNCTLTGNSAGGSVAVGGGASECTLNNCSLIGNSAIGGDFGDGGGAYSSTLNNCTLTGNSALYSGGGASGDGDIECRLNNCIVYFNTAPQRANYDSYSTLKYSCTTPLPTNGLGNITNAPLFVDLASGNLRLQSNSPCINAGLNALAPAGPDLDGNPRIVSGSVDIGAYEYQLDSTGGTITLVNAAKPPSAEFQFSFIGAPNGTYTVLMKTDLTSRWTVIGLATEFAPGLFAFREQPATSSPQRFYAVVNAFWPIETRACPGAGPNPCPCNPDLYDCIISPDGAAWKKNVNGRCPCGDVF